jgi:hypothetical protein
LIGVPTVHQVPRASPVTAVGVPATLVEVQLNNSASVSLQNTSNSSVSIVVTWLVTFNTVPVSSALISITFETSKLAISHLTEASLENAQVVQAGLTSSIPVNFAKSFGFIAAIFLLWLKYKVYDLFSTPTTEYIQKDYKLLLTWILMTCSVILSCVINK